MNKDFNYICPVCGANLWPSDHLFLNKKKVVGCEKCYGSNDDAWADEMTVTEDYFKPSNCIP